MVTPCQIHTDVETSLACERCARPFCERCLTAILGQRLCVDCKQEAVQSLLTPRHRHPQALLALLVPLVGYATCVLTPITSAIGLLIGTRVLREMRAQPQWGGRSIALAGVVVSGGTLAAWVLAVLAAVWLHRVG